MAKLQELQKKPLIKVADTANSSEHLQTRPFAPVNSSNTQQSTPSIQTKTKRAGNFGHNFGNLPVIQPKLTIGEPGDKYEQEADNVAAQVVEQINSPAVSTKNDKSVQRMETDEDELQMKPLESIQRQEIAEEEELQMKSTGSGGNAASADLETSINQARGGGQALPDNVRQPMEQAFGNDFSQVKVHTDSKSDQLNQSIQAKAFTTGQDIFFRQGEYNPGSKGGQELLAHELTHVVQQKGNVAQVKQEEPQVHSSIQRKTDISVSGNTPDLQAAEMDKSMVDQIYKWVEEKYRNYGEEDPFASKVWGWIKTNDSKFENLIETLCRIDGNEPKTFEKAKKGFKPKAKLLGLKKGANLDWQFIWTVIYHHPAVRS